ncbi:hypothetical protein [Solitalea lacus]|uniref:hypothetical protein n=1 Tax=Solitalea lacus TaxID=2911172 RepID=UPI001EDAC54B|nr:hypothetical protein [Solitalea lacus]UKJ08406.1 hypothetical protein L2B55_04345 [Solitalea lacus]
MTFEEFFLKKKIDLDALRTARPEVYTELKYHYEQMSEKSFDHTKKFWFNKLRLEFSLKEESKPVPEIVEKENASPAETSTEASPAKSGSYKPLFRKKTDTQ